MHLDQADYSIVDAILNQYVPEYDVWVFGSRVHGRNLKKFSDLDLVIINDNPLKTLQLFNIKEAFSESDLPIMVDVLTWDDIDDTFKSIILKNYEIIQKRIKNEPKNQ